MEPYSPLRNHVIRSRPDRCFRIHILAVAVLIRRPKQHFVVAHELVPLNLSGPSPMGGSNLHSPSPSALNRLA